MKNFFIVLLIVVVAILSYAQFVPNNLIGSVETNDLGYNGFTNSSVTTAGTDSTEVLAANEARQYARICNNSAAIVWLSIGEATSTSDDIITANAGVQLNTVGLTGSCWEITPQNNMYFGAVYATSTPAGSALIYTEK